MSALTMVDRQEILRYLGVKTTAVDAALADLVEQGVARVAAAATPRAITKEMSLAIDDKTVRLGMWQVESSDLAKHLQGCHTAYLLAATLGAEVDRLLARDSVASPSLAVTEQAVAAAMIELLCDEESMTLSQEGRYCRERFSPGYGDFSLIYQEELLRLLDAPRRIGLTMTDTCMLTPMKSVTAVIGVGQEERPCVHTRCARCQNRSCAFRKDDENV